MPEAVDYTTKVQENYWHKLTQFKFDLNYYAYQFSFCVKAMRWIRITSAVLTALVTGAWMNWNDIAGINVVCAIVILMLQAISAGAELLPYDKRKQEIREMLTLLDPVYDQMEADWVKISEGQYTKEDIRNKTYEYAVKRRDIQKHFFKDDALPEKKTLETKAEKETSVYFETMFK